MSRNDVILVVRVGRRYCVLAPLCADTEWDRAFVRRATRQQCRWTSSRASALVHAHNLQLRWNTEYGVRELTLWS